MVQALSGKEVINYEIYKSENDNYYIFTKYCDTNNSDLDFQLFLHKTHNQVILHHIFIMQMDNIDQNIYLILNGIFLNF